MSYYLSRPKQSKGDFYERYYYITKNKNKHLSFHHYEFIVNSLIKYGAEPGNSKRNIGRTHFVDDFSSAAGTPVPYICFFDEGTI